MLENYRLLKEDENYFENTKEDDCGVSHYRNNGFQVESRVPDIPNLSELLSIIEDRPIQHEPVVVGYEDDDDPYGLAHISTTVLKKELRRRKQSWNRRTTT